MEASVWASPYGGLQQLQQQQQQQPIWRPPAAGTNLWRGTQSLKLAESSSCWHTLLTACQLAEATANAMLVRTRWSRGHAGPAMLLAWLLAYPTTTKLAPTCERNTESETGREGLCWQVRAWASLHMPMPVQACASLHKSGKLAQACTSLCMHVQACPSPGEHVHAATCLYGGLHIGLPIWRPP